MAIAIKKKTHTAAAIIYPALITVEPCSTIKDITALEQNLEFWQTFDGLERPEHTENPQGLNSADVFAFGPPVENNHSQNPHRIIYKNM